MTATLIGGLARTVQRVGWTAARVTGATAVLGAAVGWMAGPAHAAVPPAAGQLTLVPAPGATLWVDGRPYAGQVTVAPDGAGLAVVNRVGFEDYVAGIGEMPSSWPAEALQAQAVTARTYALWTVLTHPAGPGGGQICASDYCQVYVGLAKSESPDGSDWLAAVQATRSQVLTYQGRIIEAVYGSSDGGRTVSGGVPWLPSVPDPEDALAPEHQWAWSAPLETFDRVLDVPAGRTLTSLVSSPAAITETLRGAGGSTTTRTVDPDTFHSLVNARMSAPAGLDLPLPSWRYSVSTYGTEVRLAGFGDGQGMGMSQYGALGKAEKGYSTAQILGAYYPGTDLTTLPRSEMPTAISVTLEDQVTRASLQASGPVRIEGPDGRPEGSTTGPSSWEAEPGGPGVELYPEPGGPPGAVAVSASSAPPAPMTAPAPTSAGRTVPDPRARVQGPSRRPTAAPVAAASTAGNPVGGDPVAAAYQPPPTPGRRPTGWAAVALLSLIAVTAAFARVAQPGRWLSARLVARPVGAHYRSGRRRPGPTANR